MDIKCTRKRVTTMHKLRELLALLQRPKFILSVGQFSNEILAFWQYEGPSQPLEYFKKNTMVFHYDICSISQK